MEKYQTSSEEMWNLWKTCNISSAFQQTENFSSTCTEYAFCTWGTDTIFYQYVKLMVFVAHKDNFLQGKIMTWETNVIFQRAFFY